MNMYVWSVDKEYQNIYMCIQSIFDYLPQCWTLSLSRHLNALPKLLYLQVNKTCTAILELYTNLNIYTRLIMRKTANEQPHTFSSSKSPPTMHQDTDSYAQKVSGSGLKREKSWISRFAMCQSTNRAWTTLNITKIVGKSHHSSSSRLEFHALVSGWGFKYETA